MIKIRYGNGNLTLYTMTVSELIQKLQEFDSNLPVLATWEFQYKDIREESFSKEKVSCPHYMKEDHQEALVINVE